MLGRSLGIAMVLAGALLLTLISGYYAYSVSARSQLDDLNYVVSQPLAVSAVAQPPQQPMPAVSAAAQPPVITAGPSRSAALPAVAATPSTSALSVSPPPQPVQQTAPANQEAPVRPPSSYTALYPATYIHPKFWAQPLWSGGEPYVYSPAIPARACPTDSAWYRQPTARSGGARARPQHASPSRS